MEQVEKRMNDFTEGSIFQKLIRFMIPILGALILQAMYGAVDLLIVGKFGTDEGISAISTGSNLVNVVTFVVIGLTMGVTVLISRYIGEGKDERIGKVIGGAICFFSALALVIMVLMLAFAPVLCKLLNAPAEAYDLTVLYTRICGAGMLFVVAYNVISGIFRGLGNSKLPLLFVAIACVVNIVADLLFVAVLDMNVAGAALATVLAQAVSVIMSLRIIAKGKVFHFSMKREDIAFNKEIGKFVKVGLPIAAQDLLTNLSFLILCAIINHMGLEASSGYGIAQKIVAFILLIPSALMQTISAVVAQNVGAKKEDRARQTLGIGIAIGVAIGIFITVFAFLRGDLMASVFTNNEVYMMRAAEYLKGFAPEAILTSILFSFIGYFNGHGKTVFVLIQGILQSFLIRIPVSYFMSIQPDADLVKIGIAVPLATLVGIILCTVYFVYTNRKAASLQNNTDLVS